jgi:hypothetical protein
LISWILGRRDAYIVVFVRILQKYCLGRCVLFVHLLSVLFSKQEHVRFLSGNLVFLLMEGNSDARKVLEALLPKVGAILIVNICEYLGFLHSLLFFLQTNIASWLLIFNNGTLNT